MSTLYKYIATDFSNLSAEVSTDSEIVASDREPIFAEPTNLYAQIVPEKPLILAEERIFVYIPKVTKNTAGIAKFELSQFNVLNGEVSINANFLTELKENMAQPPITVSVEEPINDTLWYKVIEPAE